MVKKAVHEEILELLPWLVNESLGEKERELVMAHLGECALCREERDRLQTIEVVVRESGEAVPDYRFAYQKLMRRIEDAERNRESTAVLAEPGAKGWWVPFTAIAAAVLVLVGSVGLFQANRQAEEPRDEFRTLTLGGETKGGMAQRVALTFHQPIPATTIRQALIETHSNIVSGPDAMGTYVIEVNVPPNMSTEDFLGSIRRIDGVRYARIFE